MGRSLAYLGERIKFDSNDKLKGMNMSGRMHEASATVLQFPLHAIRQRRGHAAGDVAGTRNVELIRPIIDTDGWYHEQAMRDELNARKS